MKLSCSSCGAQIKGADISPDRGMVVCQDCGDLIPLPERLTEEPLELAGIDIEPVYKPLDLSIQERKEEGKRIIAIVPDRGLGFLGAVFSLAWIAFAFFLYFLGIKSGEAQYGPAFWFLLLFICAGLWLFYRSLCDLFNKAFITISPQFLEFSHHPLPRRTRVSWPTEEIEGFVAQQKVSKYADEGEDRDDSVPWDVMVKSRSSTDTILKAGLSKENHARYVIQRLEEALVDIKNPKGYRG